MHTLQNALKHLAPQLAATARDLAASPVATAARIGRRLLGRIVTLPQVSRIREVARHSPLILQIETTNFCNSACVFCAYPAMRRAKGVMTLPLFRSIVEDYAGGGGGPVSLTPIIGEALLDPHLMERLDILAAHPELSQITMTSNAIALENYSDDQVRRLLGTLFVLQVSIGGLDAGTYRALYGVDRFDRVKGSLERLLELRDTLARPAQISFAFRTNDWKFESRHKELLGAYRRRGVFVSHIWTYANYSGVVKQDARLNLTVADSVEKKQHPCFYASTAMSVCWDGSITACGCADYEGNQLAIGDAAGGGLAEAWLGARRSAILTAFGNGRLPRICRDCSAYQPDTLFAGPCFTGVEAHRPLPVEFYQNLWGG